MIRFCLVLWSFYFLANPVFAQDWHLKAGVALPFDAKVNILTRGSHFSPFQSVGLDGVLRIMETDEGTLFFQPKVGFRDDLTNYLISQETNLRIFRYIICINPQIFIPLPGRLNYVIGFGLDWQVGNTLSFGTAKGTGSANFSQFDASINDRSAIPFINTGISFNITTHIFCGVNIKQAFLNYFGDDHTATFEIDNNNKVVNLSYQPTFLGIELGYFF